LERSKTPRPNSSIFGMCFRETVVLCRHRNGSEKLFLCTKKFAFVFTSKLRGGAGVSALPYPASFHRKKRSGVWPSPSGRSLKGAVTWEAAFAH
jgi:hypothetical protein